MRRKIMLVAGLGVLLGACGSEEDASQSLAGPDPESALASDSRRALIAFHSDREGRTQVYTMTRRGRRLTRLTNGDDASNGVPAWSPDRTRIAFTRFLDSGESEVYVMNSDGSGAVLLATSAKNPDWSPDGSRIAFVRDGSIVVSNADGTNQVTLPQGANDNDDVPDWSPDGTRLVIARDRDLTFSFDLWIINADGSNPIQLTSDPAEETSPAWSPDGGRIAYVSNEGTPAFEVFVIGADGGIQAQLTTVGANFHPAWSPNGRRIAFTSLRDGNAEIYVMASDGTGQTRLTNDPGNDDGPAWAP